MFQSVPDLIAAIEECLAAHNHNPKPLVWTAGRAPEVGLLIDVEGRMRVFGELEGPIVLGLAFLDDGSILSGSALQRRIYRLFPDGHIDLFADLSGEVADITNECVIGPDRSVYVGSVGLHLLQGESPVPTRLVRIAPDGSISRVGPELIMPNGIVLSDDGATLYVAESIGAKRLLLVRGG